MNEKIENTETAVENASCENEVVKKAMLYRVMVVPALSELREVVDKLELICDKTVWPYPNYEDLLFYE